MLTPYNKGGNSFNTWAISEARHIFGNKKFFKDVYSSNEIIITNYEKLKQKYEGKTILILGGGPSTSELLMRDGQIVEEFDYVWSANHFFNSPLMRQIKIDLAMMMTEPDIHSKALLDYQKTNGTTIGFELHGKWKDTNIPYDDCFVMQTRFYGILGACQRMMIFASFLGAVRIGFAGLDGAEYIKLGQHSFQPGKMTLPSVYDDRLYMCHYNEFWKYLKENCGDTEFINLGFKVDHHTNIK